MKKIIISLSSLFSINTFAENNVILDSTSKSQNSSCKIEVIFDANSSTTRNFDGNDLKKELNIKFKNNDYKICSVSKYATNDNSENNCKNRPELIPLSDSDCEADFKLHVTLTKDHYDNSQNFYSFHNDASLAKVNNYFSAVGFEGSQIGLVYNEGFLFDSDRSNYEFEQLRSVLPSCSTLQKNASNPTYTPDLKSMDKLIILDSAITH